MNIVHSHRAFNRRKRSAEGDMEMYWILNVLNVLKCTEYSFWDKMVFQGTECTLTFSQCSDTTARAAEVGLQLDVLKT